MTLLVTNAYTEPSCRLALAKETDIYVCKGKEASSHPCPHHLWAAVQHLLHHDLHSPLASFLGTCLLFHEGQPLRAAHTQRDLSLFPLGDSHCVSMWTGFTLGLVGVWSLPLLALREVSVFLLSWSCLLNTSPHPSLFHSWTTALSIPLLLIPDTLPLPKMDPGPYPVLHFEGREAETSASWDTCVPVCYRLLS